MPGNRDSRGPAKETTRRRKRPGVPDEQRKRVRVACETCRKNKLRCNGSSPCQRCHASGRQCLYETAVPHSQHDGSVQGRRKEHEETIVLGGTVASSASVIMVNQWKTHFEGNYSHWAFFDSVRQAVSPDNDQADDNGEADCSGTSIHIHQPPNLNFGCDWRTGVLSALPPRSVVDFLAMTFFRFAQSGYFCVHPEIFSRKLVAFYDGVNEFAARDARSSQRSVEFISMLFMVLAIGSQFAEVGDTTITIAEGTASDDLPLDLSQVKVPTPSQNPGWQFYQVSRKLLPDIICLSSMTSIQVCLLQGLFLPSTTSRDASYNMLGLAMRMAINMGLHRSFCSNLSLNTHVRELRNRLWWSVYIADRLYTTDMGRPLSINDAEIDAPLPKHMPAWSDEAMDTTKIDLMTALARLCHILGRIIQTVYCNHPSSSHDGSRNIIRSDNFHYLKQELQDWRTTLPPQIAFAELYSDSDPESEFPNRSIAHLSLMYEQATLLLTRPCLNSAVTIRPTPASPPTTKNPLSEDTDADTEVRRFLLQQTKTCAAAAVHVIEILSSLSAHSLLCGYSFHDSLYCSSALYVLLLVEKKFEDGVVCVPRGALRRGICILLGLARQSEAAAESVRYIIRALTVDSSRERDREKSFSAGNRGTIYARDAGNGRGAWRAWVTAQTGAGAEIEAVASSSSSSRGQERLLNKQTVSSELSLFLSCMY
ncbi:fungal-specific transcription factor domain-containing protein [Aspergillus californicus]